MQAFLNLESVDVPYLSVIQSLSNMLKNGKCDLDALPTVEQLMYLEDAVYWYSPPDVTEEFMEQNRGNPILDLMALEELKNALESMLPVRQEVGYL